MWKVKFKDDDKYYSSEFFYDMWDNVPHDKQIQEIKFRLLGKKFTFSNFDKVSIHRYGTSLIGIPRFLGYKIYFINGNNVEEIKITTENVDKIKWPIGIISNKYDISKLDDAGFRMDTLRNGTNEKS